MTFLIALVLGIIQGVTEFFPISSSAHLAIARQLLGVESHDKDVIFDLFCHLGTLFALLFFLRKDIVQILIHDRKKLFYFFIALTPLIPAYFLLKPFREFCSQPQFLGFFLIVTGGILWLGSRAQPKEGVVLYKARNLLWIGTMQAMALIPGISRSASTISTARMLGWPKCKAVRFSFLLSIPAICGGTFLEVLKIIRTSPESSISVFSCGVGFLTSFTVGSLLISFAIRFLEKGHLKPFAYYCFCLGFLICLYYSAL